MDQDEASLVLARQLQADADAEQAAQQLQRERDAQYARMLANQQYSCCPDVFAYAVEVDGESSDTAYDKGEQPGTPS